MALEVSAAIIGILAAAGQVAKTLEPVVSAFVHAPEYANTILTEVKHTRAILSGLQSLFDDLHTSPRRRKELIRVEALVAALTDGVLLFSELEALVDQLGEVEPKATVRIRTKWARHKSELDALVSRLLSFKISINLVLSILQCDSDVDAQRDRKELLAVTTKLLASNLDLASRIADLERCYHAGDTATTRPSTRRASHATIKHNVGNVNLEDTLSISSLSVTEARRRSHFEHDLEASRVYRKAQRGSADFSFRSSMAPSHAWSTLSDISLADLSAISVIALPLHRTEFSNAYHYAIEEAIGDPVPASWPTESDGHILINKTVEISYTSAVDDGSSQLEVKSPSGLLKFPEVDVRLSTEVRVMVGVAPRVDMGDLLSKFVSLSHSHHRCLDTRSDYVDLLCTVDAVSVYLAIIIMPESADVNTLPDWMIPHPGDVLMLIYNNSSRASFDFVQQYRPQFRHWEAMDVLPTMIVGYSGNQTGCREVLPEEAYELSLARGCAFLEVDEDNTSTFHEALHELVRVRWKFEKLQAEKAQNRKRHVLMVEERRKRAEERLAARKGQAPSSGAVLRKLRSEPTLQSMEAIDEDTGMTYRPVGEHGW